MISIWLDDERPEPHGTQWVRVTTSKQCIDLIIKSQEDDEKVDQLSLDHDLGEPENGTGYDVVCFLEEMKHNNQTFKLPNETFVHSANPVGRRRMLQVINKLYT